MTNQSRKSMLPDDVRLRITEELFGVRPRIAAAHGEPLQKQHFRGELADGKKFVYCPIGFIISWSDGDYDHRWCHFCKEFLNEHNNPTQGKMA